MKKHPPKTPSNETFVSTTPTKKRSAPVAQQLAVMSEPIKTLERSTAAESPVSIAKKIRRWYSQAILMTLLVIFAILLPSPSYYDQLDTSFHAPPLQNLPIALPSLRPYPIALDQATPSSTTAHAILVTDFTTKQPLYAKNAQEQWAPASLIKMLTTLTALDYCTPNQILTVPSLKQLTVEDSRAGLVEGEQMTFHNMLYALLLPSGNDAALTLAANCTDGKTDFMTLMNRKALSLGLMHTHVTNPIGEDDPNNYTDAQDLATLSYDVMQVPIVQTVVKTAYKTVTDVTRTNEHVLSNTNILLTRHIGVIGIKTGTTDEAQQNFVAEQVTATGQKILVVVLGSQNRFGETVNLLDWVQKHVAWKYPAPPVVLPNYSVSALAPQTDLPLLPKHTP